MGLGQIFSSFIHGVFAGGFGGVAAKKNSASAGVLFLLFMAGAIYWGVTEGWEILVPNTIGFALGFGSVMSNKDF